MRGLLSSVPPHPLTSPLPPLPPSLPRRRRPRLVARGGEIVRSCHTRNGLLRPCLPSEGAARKAVELHTAQDGVQWRRQVTPGTGSSTGGEELGTAGSARTEMFQTSRAFLVHVASTWVELSVQSYSTLDKSGYKLI